jgi:hypothetical protein
LRFRTLKSLALLQFQKDAVNNSDCSRVDVILFGLNSQTVPCVTKVD